MSALVGAERPVLGPFPIVSMMFCGDSSISAHGKGSMLSDSSLVLTWGRHPSGEVDTMVAFGWVGRPWVGPTDSPVRIGIVFALPKSIVTTYVASINCVELQVLRVPL